MEDSWKSLFNQMLKSKFESRRRENPNFSLRSLARLVSLNPGAVSELLAGTRSISKEKALALLGRLDFSTDELNFLRVSMGSELEIQRHTLDASANELISNRYLSIILSALDLEYPPENVDELSKLIEIEKELIESALTVLKKHGCIQERNGSLQVLANEFETTSEVPNEVIKSRHRYDLLAALDALEDFSVQERMFTSAIFPSSIEGMQAIKKEVTRFVDRVVTIGRKYGRSRVFNLSLCLYPVTAENYKSSKTSVST